MCPHGSISLIKISCERGMESFLLTHHIVYFQHSLQGLVAATAGNVNFSKFSKIKKRGTEACNLHSASIMHRAKSWEIDLKAKGGYTNL